MTPVRRLPRASHRRSSKSSGQCRLSALAWLAIASAPLASAPLLAQRRGDSPIAPSSALGPVTDSPTLSVLGLAALPDGSGNALTNRNEIWMGATQPLLKLGNVRFSAIGSGNWQARDAVGTSSSVAGLVSLRARARFGETHVWSAASYGRADLRTDAGVQMGGVRNTLIPPGFGTSAIADTTVSRRFDVGNVGRVEGGFLTNVSGIEFSFGLSVERATRVTTQTLTINEATGSIPMASAERVQAVRTLRSTQQRDIASSIASMGFNTGATQWLISLTAPVATWVSTDALGAKSKVPPAIASLAIAQPIAAWLSVIGAASTNSSTVGSIALRDEIGDSRYHRFAPIVALGLRFTQLPFRGRVDDTPRGILSFETRTIGAVDSATVEQGAPLADGDTLRVVLLIDAPRAESVELMGDVTEWTVTQLTRAKNGRWRAELKLSPGVHRLMIRADGGSWIAPPGYPVGNDDYGAPVGMIVVRRKP